jgi:D-alanyl-D-alanine carboxypeptidase (penicillin-binding protein 5/6)
MRWRSISGTVLLATLATASGALARRAPGAPAASPDPVAYYVVDADTGTVLAEKDAHKKWPPASMTKMMTVLLSMERVRNGSASLSDPVHVSTWASKIGGSQVFLAPNETFPLGEMLKAVMIASANDGAVAVAEHIAGSTQAFVDLMNQRAKELGLDDTTYQSPHGLPPGKGQTADISSAHDLAVLGRELMRFPEVMQWAGTSSAGFRNDTLQMMNTNHLVRGSFPGATGLKTGFYVDAGFCVTATATRNDMNVLAVVLGEPTKQGSFTQAARLMNEAFANYRVLVAARKGVAVGEVPISGGTESVKAIATDDLRVLVKRAEDKGVAVEARVPRQAQAPIRKQQSLGEVVVRRGDQEMGRVPVVADRDVAATGWLSWLWNRRVWN